MPRTMLPSVVVLPSRTPLSKLPERTFRAAGVVPPMVLFVDPLRSSTPVPWLAEAALPDDQRCGPLARGRYNWLLNPRARPLGAPIRLSGACHCGNLELRCR